MKGEHGEPGRRGETGAKGEPGPLGDKGEPGRYALYFLKFVYRFRL